MDVRNCSRCGKVYRYDGFRVCPNCRREDEADFQKVKEYIDEHPGANIKEVSEATEIDSRKIMEFLRAGRLEIMDENNLILSCERCGKPIKTGKFCDKCAFEIQKELKGAIAKKIVPIDQRAKEKIRITEKYRDK